MPLREHVYSVLIVSASEKLGGSIRALLPEADYAPVFIAGSVSQAQRCLQERTFDLVLINTPLPDEFGSKLAIDISQNGSSVASLLVRSELYDEIYAKVFEYGVFTIHKPTSSTVIMQALDWMRFRKRTLTPTGEENRVSGGQDGRDTPCQPCEVGAYRVSENDRGGCSPIH